MRSIRVSQRDERAKVEYELVREMESFTSKRNGALDKECENAESLTMLSRELVVKEAKRIELEKRALEAEKEGKSLDAKYEASLQEQIRIK